jgi:hypothetical protein
MKTQAQATQSILIPGRATLLERIRQVEFQPGANGR